MKRGLLAISFGTLLLLLHGCTPVSELEEENQRLLSRIDTLEVLRESCDSRLSSLSQRITALEQERVLLADANRQLSEKLTSSASLPTAVVEPAARPSAKTATPTPATAKTGKTRKGAVKLPPSGSAQIAPKETASVATDGNAPGKVILGESSVTQAVAPTPAQTSAPSIERATPEKPLPVIEPTRRRSEPFQTSKSQGTPTGPMGWPEHSPERSASRPPQETNSTRTHAPERAQSPEPATLAPAAETPVPRPPAASSRETFLSRYQSALSDFNNRKYARALEAFQALQQGPEQNEMLDNCAYWVGECRYALGDYRRAADAFGTVLSINGTDKADAALLMRGQSYAQLGRKADAKRDYRALLDRFPNSPYAKQAKRLAKALR